MFGRFHAAIGNAAYTVAAGEGVPMSDDAREAAQEAYLAVCRLIVREAGPRALNACQDLAANRSAPDRAQLKAAARAMVPGFNAGERLFAAISEAVK